MASHPGGPADDPRTRLMKEVAEEMDDLEAQFGDEFAIGRVILVAEVLRPGDAVNLRIRAGQYPWVALGMLRAAEAIIERQMGS